MKKGRIAYFKAGEQLEEINKYLKKPVVYKKVVAAKFVKFLSHLDEAVKDGFFEDTKDEIN